MDVHISGVNTKKTDVHELRIILTLSIEDIDQMQKLLRTLRSTQGVINVYRTGA